MSQENEIRSAILQRLSQIPTGGEGQPPPGIVHAEDFSRILQSLGLQFGNPVVDKIMVQCELDDSGWCNYRNFANEFHQSNQPQHQQQQRQQQQQPQSTSSPSKPYHFSQAAPSTPSVPSQNTARAIQQEQNNSQQPPQQQQQPPPQRQPQRQEQQQQAQVPPPRAPQARATPQRQRPPPANSLAHLQSPDSAVRSQSSLVRSLSSELSALYRTFDSGACGVAVLKRSLFDMGLEETPELRRLLRATPCEFSLKQLLQALTVKRIGREIQAPAGSLVKRVEGTIFAEGDVDGGDGFSGVRRGAPKMGVTHSGLDVVTWSDPKSMQDTKETGSDALNGVGHRARGQYASKVYHSDDVKDAMRRASYNAVGGAWQTTSRRQGGEAFPQRSVGNVTSSGPSTQLKPKVYDAIRLLDSSQITADDFVQRLMSLSIPIPVALERLLAKHRSNGCATFQDFVSALQPYFNDIDRQYASTQPSQEQTRAQSAGQRRGAGGSSNIGYRPSQQQYQQQSSSEAPPMALQNHGDILTWSGPRSGLEKNAQLMGAPRHKAAPHLKETSYLTSHGHPHHVVDNGGAGGDGGRHKGGGRGGAHLHEQVYGSHDIIGWHGEGMQGPGASRAPQTLGGMAGSSGKMHGAAIKLYGGTTPFGTDVDLGDGLDKSYAGGNETRKGGVRGQRGHTGAWMVQSAVSNGGGRKSGGSFRGVQAPFGTDADVRKH